MIIQCPYCGSMYGTHAYTPEKELIYVCRNCVYQETILPLPMPSEPVQGIPEDKLNVTYTISETPEEKTEHCHKCKSEVPKTYLGLCMKCFKDVLYKDKLSE